MSRRRYRYEEVRQPDGTTKVLSIEVGQEWRATDRDAGHRSEAERLDGACMVDVRMVDGKPTPVRIDLSSRTKERNHFADHKARTGRELAHTEDFKHHYEKKALERERIRKGDIGGDRERKADIGRTLYQMKEQARSRR